MDYLILGLAFGATYALVAIGLVLIFSAIRAFQLAHAALVVFLGYVFLLLFQKLGDSVPLAILATLAVACALSLVFSVVAFEPLLGRHFPSLVTGLGLALILQEVTGIYLFDGLAVAYPPELKLGGTVDLLGARVDENRLLAFGVAVVALIALDVGLRRTRVGMQIRALADDPGGAALCGTNVKRTIRTVFVVAGIAAAVAGVLLGLQLSTLNTQIAPQLLIKGIAAALLAGATSLRGAVLASFIIAIAESLAVGYISPSFSDVIAFAVILVMLVARPRGLFGQQELARA